jgi:hypothetical protein
LSNRSQPEVRAPTSRSEARNGEDRVCMGSDSQ